jgi:small subunit ribosomal protein S5|tara:strand:+ start:420 stop:1169 length:750 start_codon:yes stop_codon:yes gene_type:complete
MRKRPKLDRKEIDKARKEAILEKWVPKTEIGKMVKAGEIKNIDEILNSGKRILESEIIDTLLPHLEYDLITIGQSKGKFGGGKRSIWKQTQKKTKEGNKPKFATIAVIGNKNGYVGLGYGKAKETVPAREKAIRNAKLSIMKIRRGCGSWACACGEAHSIPLKVSGKSSSVQVELIPAPKGTNLTVQKELRKILTLAGFKDIYSKTKGKTNTAINLVKACEKALKQLNSIKINEEFTKKSGLREGKLDE